MSRVFEERVALITGASQGIGESVAQRLASEGCNLILASRRQEVCEEVGSRLAGEGIETLSVGMDVGNLEQGGDWNGESWSEGCWADAVGGKGTCFSCGEPGHYARGCPKGKGGGKGYKGKGKRG